MKGGIIRFARKMILSECVSDRVIMDIRSDPENRIYVFFKRV